MKTYELFLGLVLIGALTGCTADPGETEVGSGAIAVVASTNVYGDIVQTVGADLVDVTSIIDDPSADPHGYEANARNQLVLSRADLVVANGGGYDDFVATMLGASGNDGVTVLDVAQISGYDQEPADGEFNEHLWYDFPTVSSLVEEIVDALSEIDTDNAPTYSANGDQLKAALADLTRQEGELKATYAGAGVAITEPVPLYMLDAAGLSNLTPDEFSEAVEQDTDVPPAALLETLNLFADGEIDVLIYNKQAVGPQTEAVLSAAEENAVPVVPVTETLPAGSTYIEWMQANLDGLSAALAQ